TVIWVFVVMDTRLFEILGIHIYSPLVLETLSNAEANRELHLDGAATRSLSLLVVVVLSLQCMGLGVLRWVRNRYLPPTQRQWPVWSSLVVPVVAVLAMVVTFATRTSAQHAASYLDALPFYGALLAEPRFDAVAGELRGYPEEVGEPLVRGPHTPNILFIAAESLRADQLTPESMPRLSALAASPRCVTAKRHYSGGHTTEYGVFTLLYGLDGYHYEPFERDDVPSYPLAVLRRAGWRLHGASASQLRAWNGGGFMFEPFDSYAEFIDVPAEQGDPRVVDQLVERAEAAEGPVFAFAFFNSTHHN